MSPWPYGEAADHAGEVARTFALNLREAVGNRTLRTVAIECDVNHETVRAILEGRVWPDMRTIAHLEHGLRVSLWPQNQAK